VFAVTWPILYFGANSAMTEVTVVKFCIMDFSTVVIRSIRYQTDLSGLTPLG